MWRRRGGVGLSRSFKCVEAKNAKAGQEGEGRKGQREGDREDERQDSPVLDVSWQISRSA